MRNNIEGGWVDLRDPKAVPERLRRPILQRASEMANQVQAVADVGVENAASVVDPAALDAMFEFNDLLVVAMVEAWSFGDTITVDSVMDLPGGTYDAIQKLVAPYINDLMPSFEISTDPVSPTEPSSE